MKCGMLFQPVVDKKNINTLEHETAGAFYQLNINLTDRCRHSLFNTDGFMVGIRGRIRGGRREKAKLLVASCFNWMF